MGNFNRLLRCIQLPRLLVLQQQGGAARCFPTLISRPYHHNHHGGSPSPSPNNIQTHSLPSLSPNNCYLFRHEPATETESPKKPTHKEQGEEEEVPTSDNCPDRLYSLAAAAADSISNKRNIDEEHQMLNIIKNHNRLHVDLSNSRCIGSSRGWLLFVNRTTLALHLLNPFYANPPIIPLPAIETLPFVLRSVTRNKSPLAPSDSVGGAYSPHGCFNSSTEFLLSDELNPISSKEMMIKEDRKGGVKKFAISSNPFGSGSNCYSDYCIIMILCNNDQLAFWRLGKDKVWTPLSCNSEDRRELRYSSKEKLFYVICYQGIEAWDLHTDPSSPKMQFFRKTNGFDDSFNCPHWKWYSGNEIYVVDSSSNSHSGKLLMVKQYMARYGDDVGFDVFKLDFEQNEYSHRPLDDLGDRALLLDHNQATFVSTSQFQNILKPNSIYFIHEGPGDCINNMTLTFSLGDRSVAAPLFPSITNIIPENGASWVIPPDAIL